MISKRHSEVATYPITMPAMAKPVCEVFPTLFSFPKAICPIMAPINESNPAVMKIQDIETARDEIAKSFALSSRFSFTSSVM